MKDDAVKTTFRDREDASGNMLQFVRRPQPRSRKLSEPASAGRAVPKDRVGDSDDPGPTAA